VILCFYSYSYANTLFQNYNYSFQVWDFFDVLHLINCIIHFHWVSSIFLWKLTLLSFATMNAYLFQLVRSSFSTVWIILTFLCTTLWKLAVHWNAGMLQTAFFPALGHLHKIRNLAQTLDINQLKTQKDVMR
jgi:hypothetical protein